MQLFYSWVEALIALMMEAARTSEASENFYQTTRRNIPEDSHLHTRHRENLKSYLGVYMPFFQQRCCNFNGSCPLHLTLIMSVVH
jgi:hypothetical protein